MKRRFGLFSLADFKLPDDQKIEKLKNPLFILKTIPLKIKTTVSFWLEK